jgi:hypothetical protein
MRFERGRKLAHAARELRMAAYGDRRITISERAHTDPVKAATVDDRRHLSTIEATTGSSGWASGDNARCCDTPSTVANSTNDRATASACPTFHRSSSNGARTDSIHAGAGVYGLLITTPIAYAALLDG